MIELKEITKVFRNKDIDTNALQNINLTIADGEFISIMGPSGCGKTTLLNILGLIDVPSSGEYFLDHNPITKLSESIRTEIRKSNFSFVFQNFNLIEDLTIRENIELPLLYKKTAARERVKLVNEIIERFNLKHRAEYFPNELSGGQQQRAAIARAVISNPRIILADEPTGNLDSAHGEEVMQLLTKLNENGTTVIMVTHSMLQAQRSQRIIHLFDGHIVTENYARQINYSL